MGQVGAFHGEPPSHDPRTGVRHTFSVTVPGTSLFIAVNCYIGY